MTNADRNLFRALESVALQAAWRRYNANRRSLAVNFSRDVTLDFRGRDLSPSKIEIRSSTSSVGITQSIGMEWHCCVAQINRNGPVPRVPPTTTTS